MTDKAPNDRSIPVIAEEVDLDKRRAATGGVRVTKTAIPHQQIVEADLERQHVEVRRLSINRIVDGPLAVRQEGETLIVPVVEESVEVRKVWILKEELHITRRSEIEHHREEITVSSEQAIVERLDASGTAVAPLPADTQLQPAIDESNVESTEPDRVKHSLPDGAVPASEAVAPPSSLSILNEERNSRDTRLTERSILGGPLRP